MYVYKQTEKTLWTVGFYDPSGAWHAETDHDGREKAAERAAWLNGAQAAPRLLAALERVYREVAHHNPGLWVEVIDAIKQAGGTV